MAIVRIKAFPRWLGLTISIPHNGIVTRPRIPGAVFSCNGAQAKYLTKQCFATYCLPDGSPCAETEALLQIDPPLAIELAQPPAAIEPEAAGESSIAVDTEGEQIEPEAAGESSIAVDTEGEEIEQPESKEPDRPKKRRSAKTEDSQAGV